jgi:hypothetical protein
MKKTRLGEQEPRQKAGRDFRNMILGRTSPVAQDLRQKEKNQKKIFTAEAHIFRAGGNEISGRRQDGPFLFSTSSPNMEGRNEF